MIPILLAVLLSQTQPAIRRTTPLSDDPGMVVRQIGTVTVSGSFASAPPDGGLIGYLRMPDGGSQEVYCTNCSAGSSGWAGPDGGILGYLQLPDGGAQSVNVTNASLAVTGTFFQATQPISAAALPLPAGAATSALQGSTAVTGNVIVIQGTGTNLHTVVDSAPTTAITAAALPLPSGASTSALQTTGNTSLSSIDTKTLAAGQAAMAASSPVVIASNQSAVPTSLATLPALTAGAAMIGHVIADTGSTTAVTGNVTAIQGTGSNLHVQVDTAPTTAVTIATLPALTAGSAIIGNVRIDQTTPGTTNAVQANAGSNLNTSALALDATLTGRTQKAQVTDGTRDGTVKAASTAAGATDTALVVAISPNNTVALGAGAAVIGHVIADTGSTTAVTGNVTATQATGTNLHVVADTGSTTAVTGNVTAIQGTGSNLHVQVDTAPTTAVTIATAPALVASAAIIGNIRIDQTTPGTTNAVQANAGTNLNTSALSLSATQTDRTQKTQITDGTRDGTVKAASTAAGATDTALVVAISPNNAVALAAGVAVIGHVIADTGSTTAVTGNVTVTQATGTNLHAVLDAASAIVGKVGIDQTTPGTTNRVDIGVFPDNEPFNVAQINGVTPLMGAGATGTGSMRVTIANDSTGYSTANGTIPTQSQLESSRAVAYGSSPTAVTATNNAPRISDLEGRQYINTGHPRAVNCVLTTTATTSTQITGCEVVASNSIYVTGLSMCGDIASATASPVILQSGTSTACTGPHILWAGYHPALSCANVQFEPAIKVIVAEGLCILDAIVGTKKATITGYVAP